MSVIVTIEIPADEFLLGSVLSEIPGLRLHLERVVPSNRSVIPYVWVPQEAIDGIEETLGDAPDIESFVIDSPNGEVLIRVEWELAEDGLFSVLKAADATLLEAVGGSQGWTMTLRFDTHEQLTSFYRDGVAQGVSIEVREVHNPGLFADDRRGLSDVQ